GRAVRGDEDVAGRELTLVPLHLVLGDAGADEPAGEAAHGRADRGAAQRRQDGPRRDERTDAWNRERADAGEPAERATDDAAGAGARRGSFRRLRVLLVTQVTRAACVREED